MQAENIKIHTLYKKIENILRTLLDCYIKKEYLDKTPIGEIQYRDPKNFVPIEDIYLGAQITGSIASKNHQLSDQDLLHFRQRCLDFFIEGCAQIYKRFDVSSISGKILKELEVISTEHVVSRNYNSIAPLAIHSPNIVPPNKLNDLDREWRQLRNIKTEDFKDLDISEFWTEASRIKCADEANMFPTLSSFVLSIMCLPHSSATVERIVSEINLNKTKTRNKLSAKTLSGILHTKSLLKNQNCFDFDITPDLIKTMTSDIYKQ
ncbi:hat family dimerization domaincontaining protein-related [Holotrichia oblita]|uniref:Hat family dimerization domaincontaining protein-related n=1 Tax=Holotrichia oblita TaxID=644536 RepID=A0ACB9TRW9_HOLOL|nr:hat family dimerization domaincontaining protein-related [Holotrichia oblita]